MNNYLQERISNLTDEELKQCWEDIKSYNKTGMMGDTLIRQIRNEFAKNIGTDSWDSCCSIVTIPSILYEIAKRYYNEK